MHEIISRIENFVIGGLALIALIVACFGMAARYLLPQLPSDWTEGIFIYALLWAIWLSGGKLSAQGMHVRSEMISSRLNGRAAKLLILFQASVALVFCIVIAIYGLDVVRLAMELDERSDSSIRFPLAVYYLSMPAGLSLMAASYGYRVFDTLRGLREEAVDREIGA